MKTSVITLNNVIGTMQEPHIHNVKEGGNLILVLIKSTLQLGVQDSAVNNARKNMLWKCADSGGCGGGFRAMFRKEGGRGGLRNQGWVCFRVKTYAWVSNMAMN